MGLDIPTLQRNIPIAGDLPPSSEFHIWWQNVVKSLITTIDQQQTQITQIQNALDSAVAAKKSSARINSYTTPTSVLTSIDAGSNASIMVAGHTRIYPHDSSITLPDTAIAGANITGLNYSTKYYVYYDDSTLADTTPTFMTTIDPATAQVGAGPFRHFVGTVTTPSSGGGETTGGGGTPPGGGGGPIP